MKQRSNQQNRLFWELMAYMSEHCRPNGVQYSKEAWHDLMVLKFLGVTNIQLPTGEIYTKQITPSQLPMFPPLDNSDDPNCWENFWLNVESYCAELGYSLP